MKCDKSAKRTLLTKWAIRNCDALGFKRVCEVRRVMMRKTMTEVAEFCKTEAAKEKVEA